MPDPGNGEAGGEKQKSLNILLGNELEESFVAELNTRMAVDSELNAINAQCIDNSSIYEVAVWFVRKVRTMQEALQQVPRESLQSVCQLHIDRIELQPDKQHWRIVPAYGEGSDKGARGWAMTDLGLRFLFMAASK